MSYLDLLPEHILAQIYYYVYPEGEDSILEPVKQSNTKYVATFKFDVPGALHPYRNHCVFSIRNLRLAVWKSSLDPISDEYDKNKIGVSCNNSQLSRIHDNYLVYICKAPSNGEKLHISVKKRIRSGFMDYGPKKAPEYKLMITWYSSDELGGDQNINSLYGEQSHS